MPTIDQIREQLSVALDLNGAPADVCLANAGEGNFSFKVYLADGSAAEKVPATFGGVPVSSEVRSAR